MGPHRAAAGIDRKQKGTISPGFVVALRLDYKLSLLPQRGLQLKTLPIITYPDPPLMPLLMLNFFLVLHIPLC